MSNASLDGIQMIGGYNGSFGARLLVEGLLLRNSAGSPLGAAIDVVGGTFVNIKRVETAGFKYGVVLDQAELADVEESDFEAATAAGVWLVNNAEHQAQGISGVPSTPTAGGSFTNMIGIRKCQFNFAGTTGVGIIDDGGYTHEFDHNNFNAGANAIWIAGANGARITNSEFESQASDQVISTYLTGQGHQGGPGQNINLYIADNVMTAGSHAAVSFVNGSPVVLMNNLTSTSGTAFVGIGGIYSLNAIGNANSTSGLICDTSPVVGLFTGFAGVGVGIANPTAALEVKGGARLNTTAAQPACSSTTRGEFWFTQGATNVKDSAQVCAKDVANAYAWRTLC